MTPAAPPAMTRPASVEMAAQVQTPIVVMIPVVRIHVERIVVIAVPSVKRTAATLRAIPVATIPAVPGAMMTP
ncbi:MAG: hypothetical protein GXP29_02615 [Planctomycetes bacterium]|nr:hypothetical protein [Planctomycetota bacterium]